MRAAWFERHGGLEVIQVGEIAEPEPGPGEVVMRVRASVVNYNDIWARKGLERIHVPLPHVSGSEASGTVEAVGPGVTTWKVGDEVLAGPVKSCRLCAACLCGNEVFCKKMLIWGFQTGPWDGGHAQLARVQVQQLQPKAKGQSWEQAATNAGGFSVAWRMLVTRAQLKAGEAVLVWGASGSVGIACAILARALGALPILVTTSDAKEAWCRSLGFETVLRSDQQEIGAAVRKLGGVDVVCDSVGADVWAPSMGALKWAGRFVTCGATSGYDVPVDLRLLWNKQLSFLGSHAATTSDWIAANRLVDAGRIAIPITEVVELEGLTEVYARMEARQTMGRIVVRLP